MEIICAECGKGFFTKQMKLKMLKGQEDEIYEEVYYTCSGCGLTIAKKEIRNFPVHENEILLYNNRE